MAGAAAIGQFGGAEMNYFGQKQAASDEIDAGNMRAQALTQNSNEVLRQGAEEERVQRIQGAQAIGNIRASYGASGVQSNEGSALDVLRNSAASAERDALNIRLGAFMKSRSLNNQAGYEQWAAGRSADSHEMAATGALLGGGQAISSLPRSYPSSGGGYT